MILVILSILFCVVCAGTVVLWASRQPRVVRIATITLLALSAIMAIVQSTHLGESVSYDRWRYLEAQVDFAEYLSQASLHRVGLELGAAFVDRITGAREAIGTNLYTTRRTKFISPTQAALGTAVLLASGGWTAAPNLLWATLVALCLGVFLKVASEGMPERRQVLMALVVVLAPGSIWFRTINTKEPLLLAITGLVGALVILIIRDRPRPDRVVGLLALLTLTFVLRPPYAMLLALFFVTGILICRRPTTATWTVGIGLGVVTLTVSLFPQLIGRTRGDAVKVLKLGQLSEYYVTEIIEARTEYGSAKRVVGSNVLKAPVASGSKALLKTPIFATYYLLGPFPWQGGSMLMNLGKLQALVYWFLTALFVRNLLAWRRMSPEHRVLAWASIGLVVVLSIVESNLGTIMRHRTTWELLFFYAALALPRARAAAEPAVGNGTNATPEAALPKAG